MITKNYVKMCEKAEEIQKIKVCGLGDKGLKNNDVVAYDCGEGLKEYVCAEISQFWHFRQDLIWLPTQEQLQEMVDIKDGVNFEGFCVDIGFLCIVPYGKDYCGFRDYYRKSNSVNELMLKYVMNFKYHKTWTSEKWVKE